MVRNLNYMEEAEKRAKEKKTHVSFPQLKYPSLRDVALKYPVQWLTGKAMDDGAEGLWRIHNAIYDFGTFIDVHPGGSEWLELTKGTDITEAFECHHLNPVVEKMKDKYYVKDVTSPRNSPYTFNDNGFYRTLKRAVHEELQKVPKDISNQTDRIMDGLVVTCLLTASMTCWFRDVWIVLFCYLSSSLTLAWSVIASHNYIHKKGNWRMYIFNLCLWSYRDFRISHALSHHLFPNTLMDFELTGYEPLIYWNPRKDKPFYVYLTPLIECAFFPFNFIMNFVVRLSLVFTRKDFFKNHYRWHDVIGLLLPVWMWYTSGCYFYEAIYHWLWINCTASFIFVTIGANAAHHHPKTFHDGDEVRTTTPDWGMQELEAVMDRKDINGSLFKVMTFFGDHSLHHLFPTLDHAVLPYLYPTFLEHCRTFQAEFKMTTQFDLFVGQLQRAMMRDFTLLND